MKKESFKKELKQVLANNKQQIQFQFFYKGLEKFTTKKAFGNRLLELFDDKNVVDIKLSSVQEKGYFGRFVKGFDRVIKNETKNIELMVFNVVTRKQLDKQFYENQKMSLEERAVNGFGTYA